MPLTKHTISMTSTQSGAVRLTEEDITRLLTPQAPSAPSATAAKANETATESTAEPPKKKQKNEKKKFFPKKLAQVQPEPTRAFTDKLPTIIQLADLKHYQFIPRKVEMEEITKQVKLPNKKNPPPPLAPPGAPTLKTVPEQPKEAGSEEAKTKSDDKKEQEQLTFKEQRPKPDPTTPGSKLYWKALSEYNRLHKTRRYIQFIIPVGPKTPKVLLLSSKKNLKDFVVPGGALEHSEEESVGIQRVWNEVFRDTKTNVDITKDVQFREVLNTWFRPELKINVYPYDSKLTTLKEIIKVYLVQLPPKGKLTFNGVYESLKPVSLHDLYDSSDPQIKNIPLFLSNYRYEDIKE